MEVASSGRLQRDARACATPVLTEEGVHVGACGACTQDCSHALEDFWEGGGRPQRRVRRVHSRTPTLTVVTLASAILAAALGSCAARVAKNTSRFCAVARAARRAVVRHVLWLRLHLQVRRAAGRRTVTLTAPSIVTVPAGTVEIVVGRDEIIVVVGRVVPIHVVPIDLRIVGVEVLVLRGGVVQHGL